MCLHLLNHLASVDKMEQMLGSYGPHPQGEAYTKNFDPEESPSGMLARSGTYNVRSRVVDDDGEVYAGEKCPDQCIVIFCSLIVYQTGTGPLSWARSGEACSSSAGFTWRLSLIFPLLRKYSFLSHLLDVRMIKAECLESNVLSTQSYRIVT